MLSLITEPFALRALLTGLAVAALAGPLGCFVVWRKMAFFGDSLAHTALLGIGAGLALGAGAPLGLIVVLFGFAGLFVALEGASHLARDTILGVISHTGLALGIILIALTPAVPGGIEAFLFGDILATSWMRFFTIAGFAVIGLGLLIWQWNALVALTLHPELSRAEGLESGLTRFVFMVLIAAVVAIGVQAVGALLINALLVIPAATARRFASSPEQMAVFAALTGMIAVTSGLGASFAADIPTGPAIVASAALLFGLSLIGSTRAIER